MIDLQALKEQLKLLGHDLPDEQVVAILKEMNIEFAEDDADPLPGPEKTAGAGAPRTGSILDDFQGRPQASLPQQYPVASSAAPAPPQAAVQQSFSYGYTSPAHSAGVGLDHGKLIGGMVPRPGAAAVNHHSNGPGTQQAGNKYSDDCYEHDSDDDVDAAEEPGVSCRYCVAEAGMAGRSSDGACGHTGVHQAWTELPLASDLLGSRSSSGAGIHSLVQPGRGPGDLTDRLGRVTLNDPASASAGRQPRFKVGKGAKGAEAARPSSITRPASAAAAKDQHFKAYGSRTVLPGDRHARATSPHVLGDDDYEEEDVSDVGLSDPDKDPLHLGGQRWPPQQPGGSSAHGRAAQDPYAAWLGGRGDPLTTHLADALMAHGQLSPQASNRSVASRATTSYSTGSRRGGGAKKVDRVQRYQQLQQEWSQNRFLKQAGGTNRGTSRKPVNFHSHFASLHAAEEAERQRMLRETRAKTKKELGAATEAPTANRRDELRWQTRMRLKNQT